MEKLQELYDCLDKAGYSPGEQKPMIVAMLGTMGEAGEVVNEYLKQFHSTDVANNYAFRTLDEISRECRRGDDLKKWLRDQPSLLIPPHLPKVLSIFDEQKLDAEIADQLYYIIALMKIRNKPMEHYLKLSVDKFNSRSKKQNK